VVGLANEDINGEKKLDDLKDEAVQEGAEMGHESRAMP